MTDMKLADDRYWYDGTDGRPRYRDGSFVPRAGLLDDDKITPARLNEIDEAWRRSGEQWPVIDDAEDEPDEDDGWEGPRPVQMWRPFGTGDNRTLTLFDDPAGDTVKAGGQFLILDDRDGDDWAPAEVLDGIHLLCIDSADVADLITALQVAQQAARR